MRAGWLPKKLRDVCTLLNGRAYSKPELLAEGKYPVLRVGNFFTNNHWYYSDMELGADKYCDNGDLLYAWSASFGPRIWTGDKVIFHYHIWKVQPDIALIDKGFLFLWFLWDTERIKEDQGTGTTMIHVAKGSMEDRDILVPPLAEQRRIVGILDEAFEGLATAKANAEQNLQNARALFESHLHAVFTQRGDGWVDSTLGNVLAVLRNGLNCKQDKSGTGTRISRIESIWNAEFDLTRVGFAVLPEARKSKFRLQKGDVLFSHINSAIHVGKTAIFDANEEVVHGVNLLLMRPMPTLSPVFLNLYLKFIFAQGYWRRVCKQSINQASVNQQDINRVAIRFPGLKLQDAIVEQMNDLREETQRLESLYQRKLAALDELKKSLLHRAFSGQL